MANDNAHTNLRCPRTGSAMRPICVDGITVDVSEGCGGLWFDNYEIQKFDDACEPHGAALLAIIATMEKPVDTRPRLQSPIDDSVTMMRRHFSPAQKIVIDECPASGGVWLDPGELQIIRELFENADDRQAAEAVFVDDLKSAFANEVQDETQGEVKAKRWFGLIDWFTHTSKESTRSVA